MEDKKIDPAEMQIAASKILADGEAYFKLFEKHVPRDLGAGAEVLLYKIGNMTCMLELIALNPAASYVIVGNEAASNALKVMLPEATEVKYLKELDFKETDMKFDCIVMNPPYSRNLHLKILAEAIKHLKDEKSVCVNLSPIIKWQMAKLQEIDAPVAGTYVLERISMDEASKIFGIGQRCDLGIVSNKGIDIENLVDNCELLQKMRRRLLEAVEIGGLLKDKLETSFKDFPVAFGWAIPIVPRGDLSKRDTGCYLIVNKRPFRKENIGHHRWYNASSEHEQKLVGALYKNVCLRYVVKGLGISEIPYKILPWIDGFKKDGNLPLTFKEMCDWFGLTNEEVEIVKKEMDLYLNDEDLREVSDSKI